MKLRRFIIIWSKIHLMITYYCPKRYWDIPVLDIYEGSALWGNTLTTALLHDQNRTIHFGLIVLQISL